MTRLDDLKAELDTMFGRHTKWRLRCKDQNATSEMDQIRLAEQVLAEPCTGTVAEWQCHSLALQGVASVDLDEFLAHRPISAASQSQDDGHTANTPAYARQP
jgi:hypothetical protein